jgi:hypothetical protein
MIIDCPIRRCLKPLTFALALGAVGVVFGYENPLSPEAISDAYSVGRGRDKRAAEVMGQYTHRFPVPPRGPHIAEIQLETPYAQIVERAWQAPNYSSQDAMQEFLGKPGVFRLRVWIYLTPSYTAIVGSKDGRVILRADDFWRDFQVRFQQGSEVRANLVRGEAIYASLARAGSRLEGADVEADYSAEQIDSKPVQIEVITPDGNKVETTFDLSRLR